MARTALALQIPTTAGIIPTYTEATADGFYISSDGNTILEVINGNVASCNVTLQTPNTVDGLAVADRTIAVAAGAQKFIKLGRDYIRGETLANPGTVWVDFSVQTDVDVAAIHH